MKKALQIFKPEYLETCKKMGPLEILQFLEEFRLLMGLIQEVKEGPSQD